MKKGEMKMINIRKVEDEVWNRIKQKTNWTDDQIKLSQSMVSNTVSLYVTMMFQVYNEQLIELISGDNFIRLQNIDQTAQDILKVKEVM
ncbi:hypothetical protein BC351_10660 [Paenibacillus ferrarius]|uniref:Uncharacterized protein n=2 Tax=Paenibacillus ferrarius TaxID=1469647 RepID=A0A1V4H9M9_9BACL|nr:hypothetical protein BC351_10660 [Paenibacillus ferrarius]